MNTHDEVISSNANAKSAHIDAGLRMNPQATMISPLQRFVWLLRREFWEHKGGFFWAPIWAGGISLLLTVMGLIFAEIMAGRTLKAGKAALGDGRVIVNGLDLSSITMEMTPKNIEQLSEGVAATLSSAMIWPMLVLGFVVFFYCLGSLYDERRDRSVLFWKSLPLSDRDTVLSKVASALLTAPIIATGVGIVCMVAFLLVLSVFVVIHHGNPITLLWSPGSLLANIGVLLAALPIYVLWALPSAGWLLLCSAWARSKPFLWAVTLPIFAGVFLSWFDWMGNVDLHSTWFWKNVVGHLLLGVFPGTWIGAMPLESLTDVASGARLQMLKAMYGLMAGPHLWVGAAAGVAMIVAAIQLRRRRDDA